ncbi:N/A [soil metagenome]
MINNKDISILIVDDSDVTRGTLRVILRSEDYNVIGEATDGDDAYEMAVKLKPDIILLDMLMPKVSGLEALRSIKLVMPDILIMMVTANTDPATVSEAVQAGISGFVTKPFSAQKVLDAVAAVAEKIRQKRQAPV